MSTFKEIKVAYHELALKWHPDRNTLKIDQNINTDKFQNLVNCYNQINTDEKKRLYHNNISDKNYVWSSVYSQTNNTPDEISPSAKIIILEPSELIDESLKSLSLSDSQLENTEPTLSEAHTTLLESEIFITKEEQSKMIEDFQELNNFICDDYEILFQINPTADKSDINSFIISLINDTLYRIIFTGHCNENDKLPFLFFEDHSELCYFQYNKEVAGFLEGFMGDYHSKFLDRTDTRLDSQLTPKQQGYLEFGQSIPAIRCNNFVKMIGELVEVVNLNIYSFGYFYFGKSENLFSQFFTKFNIQNHCLYVKLLDQENDIGFKTMIKQVFEDGNIQEYISEKNASDFYSESCFGIVFPEIESLKSYRDKSYPFNLSR